MIAGGGFVIDRKAVSSFGVVFFEGGDVHVCKEGGARLVCTIARRSRWALDVSVRLYQSIRDACSKVVVLAMDI